MRTCPSPFLLLLAATAVSFPVSASSQTSTPGRDGSHDMDFNFGIWHTEITRTADPFNAPGSVVHAAGTVTVKPIWKGKGALEEIEADGPKGHWEGANLFFYDPGARQWIQTFVAATDGRFDEPAGIGEYRDGNVEYYSTATLNGRTVLDRAIWSDIKPNSHSYTESFSNDGGRTWRPVFVAHLTRLGN